VLGRVSLDGRQSIELTWSSSFGPMTVKTKPWVDAQTYLPLRSVQTQTAQRGMLLETDTTVYQILPATPANLGLLRPPIPAGFTRTATSPHF
jgi:hypothetical protein